MLLSNLPSEGFACRLVVYKKRCIYICFAYWLHMEKWFGCCTCETNFPCNISTPFEPLFCEPCFEPLKIEKQLPEVFYKKTALKHFAIFIGKHLLWSLLLMKFQASKFLRTSSSNKICEHLLLFVVLMCIWKSYQLKVNYGSYNRIFPYTVNVLI